MENTVDARNPAPVEVVFLKSNYLQGFIRTSQVVSRISSINTVLRWCTFELAAFLHSQPEGTVKQVCFKFIFFLKNDMKYIESHPRNCDSSPVVQKCLSVVYTSTGSPDHWNGPTKRGERSGGLLADHLGPRHFRDCVACVVNGRLETNTKTITNKNSKELERGFWAI